MTAEDLVAKKLALIETYVRELRTLSRPDAISTEVRERRFVEHTLIQAAIDVASHIVSNDRLSEPGTSSQLFELLGQAGWLQPAHADRLRKMTGFRNILVHRYATVDSTIVRDVLENHLDDLIDFVAAVRARMATPAP